MKILNEYSPINLRQISGEPSVLNDVLINSVLPSRREFGIYGLWDGSSYYSDYYYFIPNSTVKIANPATTIDQMGEGTRPLKTPEYPEISITSSEGIILRGLATRETVANYLENTFMPNGELSEYYSTVEEDWGEGDFSFYFKDDGDNFAFTDAQYMDSMFPWEILFECPVDYELDVNGEFGFPVVFDNTDNADLFAIYGRKKYTYNFYYPDSYNDGALYYTEDVYYGEIPVDPYTLSGNIENELPPASYSIRYKIEANTSGADIEYSAVKDSESVNGTFVFDKFEFLGNLWSVKSNKAGWDIKLNNYPAGEGVNTSFKMFVSEDKPVLTVIDGVIEGIDSQSYGYNNGYHPVTNYYLNNYDRFYDYTNNKPCVFNQWFWPSNITLPQICTKSPSPGNNARVYDSSSRNYLRKDSMVGWFYDPNCLKLRAGRGYDMYVSQTVQFGINEGPIFVYTKMKDRHRVSIINELTSLQLPDTDPIYHYFYPIDTADFGLERLNTQYSINRVESGETYTSLKTYFTKNNNNEYEPANLDEVYNEGDTITGEYYYPVGRIGFIVPSTSDGGSWNGTPVVIQSLTDGYTLEIVSSTNNTTNIVVASGWEDVDTSETYPSSFVVTRDMLIKPITTTYSKPIMRVPIDSSVTVDTSNVDFTVYSCETVTIDSVQYLEVMAIGADANSVTTDWTFDLTQFDFIKNGASPSSYSPAAPSAKAGEVTVVTPVW